jgi:hypothetical protein
MNASTVLRAPFTRRTRAEVSYAVVGLPLGIAGFVFTVVSVPPSLLTSGGGMFIGLTVLTESGLASRRLGGAHRSLARRLLGVKVEAPAPFQPKPGMVGWLRSGLTDMVAWRARAYLVLQFPLVVASFAVAAIMWGTPVVAVAVPAARVFAGSRLPVFLGSKMLLLVVVAAVFLLAGPWVLRALLSLDVRLIRWLLGPGSARAPVSDPEQTQILDDSAARLRSIERDLHDGAQAQLVAVAMKLSLAKEKLGGGLVGAQPEVDVARAYELVDTAQRTAAEAVSELRGLASGGLDISSPGPTVETAEIPSRTPET